MKMTSFFSGGCNPVFFPEPGYQSCSGSIGCVSQDFDYLLSELPGHRPYRHHLQCKHPSVYFWPLERRLSGFPAHVCTRFFEFILWGCTPAKAYRIVPVSWSRQRENHSWWLIFQLVLSSSIIFSSTSLSFYFTVAEKSRNNSFRFFVKDCKWQLWILKKRRDETCR